MKVLALVMKVLFEYIVPYGVIFGGGVTIFYVLYLGLFHSCR
jgi:hypothetical protein